MPPTRLIIVMRNKLINHSNNSVITDMVVREYYPSIPYSSGPARTTFSP